LTVTGSRTPDPQHTYEEAVHTLFENVWAAIEVVGGAMTESREPTASSVERRADTAAVVVVTLLDRDSERRCSSCRR
jgi:hypothetical protein